jgi:hypothetical protein
MDLPESTTSYFLLTGFLLLLGATFLFFQQDTKFVKWLQKKNYQYEVTFALYMLSPAEKFIFSKHDTHSLPLLRPSPRAVAPDRSTH